ncbi:dipeptidase [Maribacter polysaccharolyticus]|uniref:dipeptidase n=1 Tax=Maribacter polysaccharolyticus TaxID=3020831 RepID=UPI00237FB8BF|nr:membrane dipeptidase [Maribacter polysaccharolyticus]MDE3742964.1 membrane dipeptidase [Maribacter polysaccharolyticus]
MFVFDAHLDLAMNAMEWNRDLTWSVESIRTSEIGMSDKPDRNKNTVSLRAMRMGNVGLCVATQIARYTKRTNPLPGWKSPQQAWAHTQGQLAWYRTMEDLGEMVQIRNKEQLNAHLELWNGTQEKKPVGYILGLEGADSIITMDYLEKSYDQGLRTIGPAHYGPGTYAQGTNGSGGLGIKGKELLKEIERLGLILDMSHLNDKCFWETMKFHDGPIWASHTNCRTLAEHNRQFSDEQIKQLIKRGAVIGTALDAWMLVSDWIRGMSTPGGLGVTLHNVIDNIDHICQLAGNSNHVGIGSDLDGGFGTDRCPSDLDNISDVQKIPKMLQQRGYSHEDIEKIMHKNFLRFLQNTWD